MRGNRLRDNILIMGNLHKTCYIKIMIHIECYNLYYKYVNKVDKLTSIVLTPIGEEPNLYAILTATSMFSTLIGGYATVVCHGTLAVYLFT